LDEPKRASGFIRFGSMNVEIRIGAWDTRSLLYIELN
jgi:hypothetical protein